MVQTVINGREVLSFGTILRHVKCILQVSQVAMRAEWPDLETQWVSHFSWVTISCSPVQLVLNINEPTDLNGDSPVPLLSRDSPVSLWKTYSFCMLCQVLSTLTVSVYQWWSPDHQDSTRWTTCTELRHSLCNLFRALPCLKLYATKCASLYLCV